MMMNTFSAFDPLTSSPFSTTLMNNWFTMMMPMLFLVKTLSMKSGNYYTITKMILNMNMKELSYNIKKMPKTSMMMMAIFIWILMNNLTSLLPYIFPANTHMAITLTMAIMVVLAIDLYAYTKMLKKTMMHLMPMNIPLILAPFMIIIELISNNIRAFTLTIRLTANILAGHVIISIIMDATTPLMISFLLITPQLPILIMELVMAYIQAYVFMTLISLYSSQNTN